MTIYIVWFYDSEGNRDLVAITNEPMKWLEENNKQRVNDGEEPEEIDDFEIEAYGAYIYD
tara:strand:- start:3400 stop:3579 length:180 start_codon:yes stop_codon:yes gene_type:complete